MPLFNWQKKKDDAGNELFELPEELAKQIKEGAEASSKVAGIEATLKEMRDEQKREREAREAKEREIAEAEARRRQATASASTTEELQELWLTDPVAAAKKQAEPANIAIMTLRADQIKRDVFEDVEKFDLYTGDIKREVDALIAGQSLQAKNDPSVVENCYHTVIGRHTKELREGKLKSRFAGASSGSSTSTGSAGDSGTGGKRQLEITDDIRRAAKQVGIKPEDYVEMLDKEGVI